MKEHEEQLLNSLDVMTETVIEIGELLSSIISDNLSEDCVSEYLRLRESIPRVHSMLTGRIKTLTENVSVIYALLLNNLHYNLEALTRSNRKIELLGHECEHTNSLFYYICDDKLILQDKSEIKSLHSSFLQKIIEFDEAVKIYNDKNEKYGSLWTLKQGKDEYNRKTKIEIE